MLMLSSCGQDREVVYSRFVDIDPGGWSVEEFCEFNTAEADSSLFADKTARYDVLLAVRHTDDFPYRELYLPAVQSEHVSGLLPDTLKVSLASSGGGWRGVHSKGIYVVSDTLLSDVELPQLYFLRLYHAMPDRKLAGLLSIGVIIERTSHH